MLIRAVLDGQRGEALWSVIVECLQFPTDTAAPLKALLEELLLFCFRPALAPQPFEFNREYTQQLSELILKANVTIWKGMLTTGWRDPKREGLVMLSRVLFGAMSLLSALNAEGPWRALILEEVG